MSSVARLKLKLAMKGRAFLLRKGMSKSFTLLKGSFAITSGYLFLSRTIAASVARFRLGYGPDLVSLARRGLASSLECRWCKHRLEDREHLLLNCAGVASMCVPLARFKNVVGVLGDGVEWDVVGPVLHQVYMFCTS